MYWSRNVKVFFSNRELWISSGEECWIAGVVLGLKVERNRADVWDWSHSLGRRGGVVERLLCIWQECSSACTCSSWVKLCWELRFIKMDKKWGQWHCAAPYTIADSCLPWTILTGLMLCLFRDTGKGKLLKEWLEKQMGNNVQVNHKLFMCCLLQT